MKTYGTDGLRSIRIRILFPCESEIRNHVFSNLNILKNFKLLQESSAAYIDTTSKRIM